jgi:hypothetical protein
LFELPAQGVPDRRPGETRSLGHNDHDDREGPPLPVVEGKKILRDP